jgi:hypothetical protein
VREVVVKKNESQTTTTTVVSEEREAQGFTAAEERILRMRSGAALPPDARLDNKLDGVAQAHRDDVAARLALIEAEALAAIAGTDADADEPAPDVERTRRIVAALRAKRQD